MYIWGINYKSVLSFKHTISHLFPWPLFFFITALKLSLSISPFVSSHDIHLSL